MVSFNLKWLFIPFAIYAIYCLGIIASGLYITVYDYFIPQHDFSGAAFLYFLIVYGPWFLGSALFSFLFWKAFK